MGNISQLQSLKCSPPSKYCNSIITYPTGMTENKTVNTQIEGIFTKPINQQEQKQQTYKLNSFSQFNQLSCMCPYVSHNPRKRPEKISVPLLELNPSRESINTLHSRCHWNFTCQESLVLDCLCFRGIQCSKSMNIK